jgi:hypothetical protein
MRACVQLWLDLSQLPEGEAARLVVVHAFFVVATVDRREQGLLQFSPVGIPKLRPPPLHFPYLGGFMAMLWLPQVEAGGHGHDPASAGAV